MYKFLKLHSSSSGDARRHVPFASIIHKHIFPIFFVTILFLTLFFRPYAAEALAQLTPEIQPVYDTTIESLYDFVKVQLNDTNKQVFDLFLGSYMVGYAGMSDYKLQYVYNSDSSVKEWLINTGADLYNTILSLGGIAPSGSSSLSGVPNIGYQQLSPLLQYAMGCAIKSKQYIDVDDALSDIQSSDNYPIPLKPDIMFSINAAMGYYDSLYEWQFDTKPFKSSVNYKTETINPSSLNSYNNYYNSLPSPKVKANGTYYNLVLSSPIFSSYTNIFISTESDTSNSWYICDDNGNRVPAGSYHFEYVQTYQGITSQESGNISNYFNNIYGTYQVSNFSTILDVARAIYNFQLIPTYNPTNWLLYYEDFVKHVYFGNSWNNKQELFNIEDLNYDLPDVPTYYPGVDNGLLDLKGLLEDILGELQLRPPVINNYYYPDGDNVPVADMEPATTNNTLPESGVDIDQGIFSNLFRSEGKDTYISYLWYMTKPLILYTKDLFDCLIFDPVENFAASGPGYFVYGVVSLGLISGLLVKCLL